MSRPYWERNDWPERPANALRRRQEIDAFIAENGVYPEEGDLGDLLPEGIVFGEDEPDA